MIGQGALWNNAVSAHQGDEKSKPDGTIEKL